MLVRTPLMSSNVELSEGDGLYWKQVLPLDYKLDYNGHKLHFDKTYINNVITAYKQNALGDPVAFQLADDENRHDTPEDERKGRNHDPQRFRGSVHAMKLVEDKSDPSENGLWCGFKLTDAGKKLVDDNMELGVSASLSQGFDPQYPVIMRHVVGTIHPKIKNMKGWKKALVSLSDVENPKEEVLSFMPEEKKEETPDKVEINKSDWDNVMAYVKAKQEEDQELEKFLEDAANEGEGSTENNEPQLANLSEMPEFKAMQVELAETRTNAANDRWQRERSEFAKAGVPKAMLDLAEPVMKRVGAVNINLSDGSTVTDQDQMRKMLHEAKGFVDLSEEEGFGRSETKMTEEEKKQANEDWNSILSDFTLNDTF